MSHDELTALITTLVATLSGFALAARNAPIRQIRVRLDMLLSAVEALQHVINNVPARNPEGDQ